MRDQPGDGPEQRGLAGPVGADDGDPLALGDRERQVPEHVAPAERDRQPLGAEDGRRIGHAAA